MAQRRFETTLFELVSMLSEATRDDAQTVGIVADLIREGRAFDSRGIAMQLVAERNLDRFGSPPGSRFARESLNRRI